MKNLKKALKITLSIILTPILLFFLLTLIFWTFKSPSNNRTWEFGQQKLPQVIFNENQVTIKNLRTYDWTKEGKEESYTNLKFNINDIESLEVGESHFSIHEGIGHIFLIFNLKDGRNVALSIESRREKNEEFKILKGLKFDYELMYVLATKEDLLSLRKKRKERVYIYPIKATPKKSQELFKLIAQKVNSLYNNPEFYHILFKNCTNLITREVEKISDKRFPLYEKTFAPGYAGKAIYEMGLIDTPSNKEEFANIQKKYLIPFN